MKIFKFGGGSVKDAQGVKQLEKIVSAHSGGPLIVVISAIGKTTNLLERIWTAFYQQDNTQQTTLVEELKENHLRIASELMPGSDVLKQSIIPLFEQLEEKLSEPPSDNLDYEYDQIVSFGEGLSTTLISAYLNEKGIKNQWRNASHLIRTDNTYREGRVNWEVTVPRIEKKIKTTMQEQGVSVIVTQGFLGGTTEKLVTTLGREGSDYSAAIFGYALNADEVVIWKDVAGFFNADPKTFPDAVKLDLVPYEEAIELSYYGASIIHPKTLKPLQNKKIPLYVSSFFNPDEKGTVISSEEPKEYTPSYIFKKNQILISVYPRDFSFIAVENLSEIFEILSKNRIKINLMQNSALSFSICVDNIEGRIGPALEELKELYNIKYNNKVQLATIRHYTEESLEKVVKNRKIWIEQKNRTTMQLVIAE